MGVDAPPSPSRARGGGRCISASLPSPGAGGSGTRPSSTRSLRGRGLSAGGSNRVRRSRPSSGGRSTGGGGKRDTARRRIRRSRRRPRSADAAADRKSTRLNSSHLVISYAVFCLKKKKKTMTELELILARHSL